MKKKRLVLALIGVLTLIFLGLIYAWSVFVGPLESEFGWLRSETSLTFTICMCAFCIGCVSGGFIVKKLSARVVMLIAAAFVLGGFLLSSGTKTLLDLYVRYGVLCGFGVGLGYNAVLSSIMRWFPDRQGLASGLLLMGFGMGGSVLGPVAVLLMSGDGGWRGAFTILGIGLAALIALSALVLKPPKETELAELQSGLKRKVAAGNEVTTSAMLKTRSFWGYFLWTMLLSAVGLAVIGSAAQISGSIVADISIGTTAAACVSFANGLGRLAFGFAFDYIGSKKNLVIISAGFVLALVALMGALYLSSVALMFAGLILTGVFFGGVTPMNSAYIGRVFGQKHYSINFSVVNSVVIFASFLGPYAAGLLVEGGGYLLVCAVLTVEAIAAFACTLLINRHAAGKTAIRAAEQ